MAWEITDSYVIKLGGNYFINCQQIIVFEDENLFTVKRRSNDLSIGIDFEVYDANGNRIAIIRNSNVVDGDSNAYDIYHGPSCQRITEKSNNRIICQIDKISQQKGVELEVSVNTYLPNGFLLEATPDSINFNTNVMTACTFSNLQAGIGIGQGTCKVGVRL